MSYNEIPYSSSPNKTRRLLSWSPWSNQQDINSKKAVQSSSPIISRPTSEITKSSFVSTPQINLNSRSLSFTRAKAKLRETFSLENSRSQTRSPSPPKIPPKTTELRVISTPTNTDPRRSFKSPSTEPRKAFTSQLHHSVSSLLNLPSVEHASLDHSIKIYIDESDDDPDSFYTPAKIPEDWQNPPPNSIHHCFGKSEDSESLFSNNDDLAREEPPNWLNQSKSLSGLQGHWNSASNKQNEMESSNIMNKLNLSNFSVTVTHQRSISKGKRAAFSSSARSSPTKTRMNSIPSLNSSQSQVSLSISSFSKSTSELPHFKVSHLAELTEVTLVDYEKRLENIRDKHVCNCLVLFTSR
ncbi:hypothetical protein HK096_000457 [Nowakowskiella sp. JEL0078]|nr:hypothetical protein HK096_000457 [Nowakowskiella sp. JEL0078]